MDSMCPCTNYIPGCSVNANILSFSPSPPSPPSPSHPHAHTHTHLLLIALTTGHRTGTLVIGTLTSNEWASHLLWIKSSPNSSS